MSPSQPARQHPLPPLRVCAVGGVALHPCGTLDAAAWHAKCNLKNLTRNSSCFKSDALNLHSLLINIALSKVLTAERQRMLSKIVGQVITDREGERGRERRE